MKSSESQINLKDATACAAQENDKTPHKFAPIHQIHSEVHITLDKLLAVGNTVKGINVCICGYQLWKKSSDRH